LLNYKYSECEINSFFGAMISKLKFECAYFCIFDWFCRKVLILKLLCLFCTFWQVFQISNLKLKIINYILPKSITFLEKKGIKLSDSLKMVEDAKNKIVNLKCTKGKAVIHKLNYVLEKNPGFKALWKIPKILSGKVEDMEGFGLFLYML
jgi:hypothetical protein